MTSASVKVPYLETPRAVRLPDMKSDPGTVDRGQVRVPVAARSVVVAVDRDACFVEQKGAVLVHGWEAAGWFQVGELFVGQRENDAAEAGPTSTTPTTTASRAVP